MLDEDKAGLGQGKPVSAVVRGGEGGGEPIPWPPDEVGGVEKVSF